MGPGPFFLDRFSERFILKLNYIICPDRGAADKSTFFLKRPGSRERKGEAAEGIKRFPPFYLPGLPENIRWTAARDAERCHQA